MTWVETFVLILAVGALLVVVVALLAQLPQLGWQLFTGSPPPLPLPGSAIKELVMLAELQPGETVCDLGCGTGKLLLSLGKSQPKANLIGVDHDLLVLWAARWRLRGRKASLIRGDIMKTDLYQADLVTCYLNPATMAQLSNGFAERLKPGARLISADYPLPGVKAARVVKVKTDHPRGRTLYLYKF